MGCCIRSCFCICVIVIVLGVCGGNWGIDWCGRAISPVGAILLPSPGRKPWVNSQSTYIEPQRGGTNIRTSFTRSVCWVLQDTTSIELSE